MKSVFFYFLGAGFLGLLGSTFYGIRSDIKELRREMTNGFAQLTEKVAANGERILVNGERIAANGKQIAENRKLIEANRDLIAANGKQIAEIGARVSALEGKVGQRPAPETPPHPPASIEAEAHGTQAIAS
ncbi:MAG: hypothetical protein OXH10_08770 [bacterium]|nr:hypothetical protein [bacterium]